MQYDLSNQQDSGSRHIITTIMVTAIALWLILDDAVEYFEYDVHDYSA
jgi:hypothetical protein